MSSKTPFEQAGANAQTASERTSGCYQKYYLPAERSIIITSIIFFIQYTCNSIFLKADSKNEMTRLIFFISPSPDLSKKARGWHE